MKSFFALLTLVLLSSQSIFAQNTDAAHRFYNENAVVALPDGMIKNGVVSHRFFFVDPLRNEIPEKTPAYNTFQSSKSKFIAGNILAYTGGLATAVGIVGVSVSEVPTDRRTSGAILGVGIGSLVASTIFINQANTLRNKAIWEHNRDMLVRTAEAENWEMSASVIANNYDRRAIYLSNYGFYQNGQRQPLGFLGGNLQRTLKSSAMANTSFKRSKNQQIGAFILSLAGSALVLSSLDYSNSTVNSLNRPLYWTGLGAMVSSGLLSNRAQTNLAKAVWHYNREVTLGK
jgi:hypothetical protein